MDECVSFTEILATKLTNQIMASSPLALLPGSITIGDTSLEPKKAAEKYLLEAFKKMAGSGAKVCLSGKKDSADCGGDPHARPPIASKPCCKFSDPKLDLVDFPSKIGPLHIVPPPSTVTMTIEFSPRCTVLGHQHNCKPPDCKPDVITCERPVLDVSVSVESLAVGGSVKFPLGLEKTLGSTCKFPK